VRFLWLRRVWTTDQAGVLALSWLFTACPLSDNYFIDTPSTGLGAEAGGVDGGTDGKRDAPPPPPAPDGPVEADGGDDASHADAKAGIDADATSGMVVEGGSVDDGAKGARDADSMTGSDAGGTVLFSDNFENHAVGVQAAGWTRVGGSANDWVVASESSHVFVQANSPSSTIRFCHAGPLTSGAANISARTKVTLIGTSGITTAMVCIRYAASGDYHCLGLEPGIGLQIKTNQGDGPVWPAGIAIGTWYQLRLGVDASGLLSAYLDGNLMGTFRPATSIGSGDVAVSTQSAEAAFDDVVLTSP
jgi:hypothetical protein